MVTVIGISFLHGYLNCVKSVTESGIKKLPRNNVSGQLRLNLMQHLYLQMTSFCSKRWPLAFTLTM